MKKLLKYSFYIIIILLLFIKLFENKIYFKKKISQKEKFTNNKNNNTQHKHIIINFGDKELSKEVYNNDNYISNFNTLNIQMRNFDSKKDLKAFYKNESFINITKEEEEAFRFMILKLLEKINNKTLYKFITNSLLNITIVKSNNNLEYGMPHTLKKNIIFPESLFSNIVNKHNLNLVSSLLENEGLTFLHELMHIHQRYNKEKYLNLYKKWGFEKADFIHNYENLKYRNRHNPDGLNLDWVWKNNNKYYIINAVFNKNPTSLIDVSYIAKYITKNDKNIYSNNNDTLIKLNNFDNFNKFFGITNNHYHPNEIASQYFEYYINIYYLKNQEHINNKGFQYFKQNINYILE